MAGLWLLTLSGRLVPLLSLRGCPGVCRENTLRAFRERGSLGSSALCALGWEACTHSSSPHRAGKDPRRLSLERRG